jgi:hypothetical protein
MTKAIGALGRAYLTPLVDTPPHPHIAAGIFKQNFKVKFKIKTKVIAW